MKLVSSEVTIQMSIEEINDLTETLKQAVDLIGIPLNSITLVYHKEDYERGIHKLDKWILSLKEVLLMEAN